jgi:type IV secretory pathway VirB2 component (pilin)
MSSLPLDMTAASAQARQSPSVADRTTQLMCAWCGPVATILALLGMVVIGGYIPATDPAASGADIAAFYVNNLGSVRSGMVISMIAFSLFVPFGIAIALQTRRIERLPVMTYVQISAVAIASLEGVMSTAIWLTAAFRPAEIDPELTRALHDLGWICFLVDIPPFSIWIAAVGIAILRDPHPKPLFPRSVGFFNLWVSLLITPAMLIPFFKSGPFAYNGLLALYLPFGVFFLWMVVMTPAVLKAMSTHRDAAGTPS